MFFKKLDDRWAKSPTTEKRGSNELMHFARQNEYKWECCQLQLPTVWNGGCALNNRTCVWRMVVLHNEHCVCSLHPIIVYPLPRVSCIEVLLLLVRGSGLDKVLILYRKQMGKNWDVCTPNIFSIIRSMFGEEENDWVSERAREGKEKHNFDNCLFFPLLALLYYYIAAASSF